jgi:hypothetical protein
MLSVNYDEFGKQALYAECHCAECHYAECHYAECRGALKKLSIKFFPYRQLWLGIEHCLNAECQCLISLC